MDPCSLEDAQERSRLDGHPWQGKRLRRAFAHKAMNRRIQGSAARQTKMAMVIIGEEVGIPLLQMHDDLNFSLPPTPEGKKSGERIVEIMQTVYRCRVPFLVDAEWGLTWGDAKHTFEEAVASARKSVAPATNSGPRPGRAEPRKKISGQR